MFSTTANPWTEARLSQLGPSEHDFQEYKSALYLADGREIATTFLNGLSKQVSAFANGAGGHIFFGIRDDGKIDGGIVSDLKPGGTRSWIEDIVPGIVTPSLGRFNVFEVAPGGPDSQILPGRAVYVLEIPPSPEAPHQALDHRYYLRIAGKSRPMGHVHVQDVLRRTRHPRVRLSRIGPYGAPVRDVGDPRGPEVHVCLQAFLENEGRNLAHHVGVELIVPRPMIGSRVRRRNLEPDRVHLTQSPGEITLFRYHPVPLFPGQEIFFHRFWIGLHRGNRDLVRSGGGGVAWRVYADDAAPVDGHQPLIRFAAVRQALTTLDGLLDRDRAP